MRSAAFTLALLIGAACLFNCECKPKGGRGRPGEPPFLQGVSQEARKEYYKIIHSDKKISEQKQEVLAWAKKNNVEKELEEFNSKLTEFVGQMKQNISSLIEQLPSKYQELTKIFENEDQTRKEMFEAVEAFRKESPEAFLVLNIVSRIFMHRHHSGLGGPDRDAGVQKSILEAYDPQLFSDFLGNFPDLLEGQYIANL